MKALRPCRGGSASSGQSGPAAVVGLRHGQVTGRGRVMGWSANLGFHPVPYFGAPRLVESHYLSMRSRRQQSILTFLAQDAESQVFCYSNADIRKGEGAEE